VKERVILAVKFTPAGSGAQVRKAVGGFLRYVQHRDVHPTQAPIRTDQKVAGLLKYVAYRDRASSRAELFGPAGALGSAERKAFGSFVVGSLESSRAQQYRDRNGQLQDRRRAVYRMVISPERAHGLDLRRLTAAAVGRLEQESGTSDLRWMAAIHRNTTHHHVHLVLAGIHEDGNGGFTRIDITKPRLAAMKEAVGLEIQRQRAERTPSLNAVELPKSVAVSRPAASSPHQAAAIRAQQQVAVPTRVGHRDPGRRLLPLPLTASVIALRAVARRYQRQMQRELEDGYRQSQREFAA
jgi:MobL relaxases